MKFVNVYPCPLWDDSFPALYGLIKRGTWASAKQYLYWRDVHGEEDADSMWVKKSEPPAGAELCILFEETFDGIGNVRFGRKQRRRQRHLWCNSGGILRIDTVKFGYNDKEGASWPESVVVGEVVERPANLEAVRLTEEREQAARDHAAHAEAEKALQQKAVVEDGRQQIEGEVLSVKEVSGDWGYTTKILVRRDDGARLFGTAPANCAIERGSRVRFTATVEKKEPGFGLFKRPRAG